MDQSALVFQFGDAHQAGLAFGTLQELGYEPTYHSDGDPSTLHIHVKNQDLTSALEITQAHGGTLIEDQEIGQTALFNSAYGIDGILIPAHTVNEDWQYYGQPQEQEHGKDVTLL